jgi:hypothetical protein
MTPTDKTGPASATAWNGHLRDISARDFAALGVKQVAYVKSIALPDRVAYVVHAADGTPLSVHENAPSAVQTALRNDLDPLTVH